MSSATWDISLANRWIASVRDDLGSSHEASPMLDMAMACLTDALDALGSQQEGASNLRWAVGVHEGVRTGLYGPLSPPQGYRGSFLQAQYEAAVEEAVSRGWQVELMEGDDLRELTEMAVQYLNDWISVEGHEWGFLNGFFGLWKEVSDE